MQKKKIIKEKRESVFLTKEASFPVVAVTQSKGDLFSHSPQGRTTIYTLQAGLGNNALEVRVNPN